MNAAEDYLSETSQRELASGVLKQVAYDLRRFHGATTAIERELYFDAYHWITSSDTAWPFSFLNVCQLLNLAPEVLREDLIGDASSGILSYLTRHCGRATRKFRTFLSHAFTTNRNPTAVDPVPLTHVPIDMKSIEPGFAQKLRRILRSVVRGSTYRHDPLLINSLARFNFRPPIILKFPGERFTRVSGFSQ